MNVPRRGFTLIEILVVIGIIIILVGIVLVGAGSLTGTSKERATRVALENLRSMVAELEAKTAAGELNNMVPPLTSPITATGAENSQAYNNQPESTQLVQTRRVMAKLLSIPDNKRAMSQLPPEQLVPATAPGGNDVLIKDGFQHNILFVPSGGLTAVTRGENPPAIVLAPNSRPFFASPGPDGSFAKGDDNLYSFDN